MDCSSFSSSSVSVRLLGAEGPGRDMLASAVMFTMGESQQWNVRGVRRSMMGLESGASQAKVERGVLFGGVVLAHRVGSAGAALSSMDLTVEVVFGTKTRPGSRRVGNWSIRGC